MLSDEIVPVTKSQIIVGFSLDCVVLNSLTISIYIHILVYLLSLLLLVQFSYRRHLHELEKELYFNVNTVES